MVNCQLDVPPGSRITATYSKKKRTSHYIVYAPDVRLLTKRTIYYVDTLSIELLEDDHKVR